MKRIDYKEQYEKIKPGEFFVIMFDDDWVECISRSLKNNRLYSYINIFTSHEITKEYEERVFTIEIDTKGKEVKTLVCAYDMFLAINRRKIINDLKFCLENPEVSDNFRKIRREMIKYGGKCVRTDSGEDVFLLGATATDEDYYYVYIDGKFKISCSSCVGKFGEVLEKVPETLKKFVRVKTENVSSRVYDALTLRLSEQPEVFFTPIYFDFIDKYALPRMMMMSYLFDDAYLT